MCITSNILVNRPTLSFIIPALNEEDVIVQTLASIRAAVEGTYRYEIIVVDHGSSDSTPALVRNAGAQLIEHEGGTIGGLRNRGAKAAQGDVLLFLDADVRLTLKWQEALPNALALLGNDPSAVTGSICQVPSHGTWIERTWFAPRGQQHMSHLGSGHLLVTKELFDRLHGFDERLSTGEDFDLCARARQHGGRIVPDDGLIAEHHGFPRTLWQFVKREVWHGSGDFSSASHILRSRIAQAALLFAALHIVFAVGIVLGHYSMAGSAFLGIVMLLLASAGRRYGGAGWRIIIANSLIYYVYYSARFASAVLVLAGRQPASSRGSAGRHQRPLDFGIDIHRDDR